MHEILRNLPENARVLDLGALAGSFPAELCPWVLTVRVDLERPAGGSNDAFVQADAARLPFPDHSFDAVIANHSLEHIRGIHDALAEVGRVLRPEGNVYAAVPDASTFSDKLYRWVYQERSGHINPFCSASDLASEISRAAGLPLTASRDLYSSFEYLNGYYFRPLTPWRVRAIGNGSRWSLLMLSYLTRLFDRVFRTRTSQYGWAFYFGPLKEQIEQTPWSNVCVGCGAGHAAPWLLVNRLVRRHLLVFRSYRCPACGSFNFFTPDRNEPVTAKDPT